jgi:hypothetical protein
MGRPAIGGPEVGGLDIGGPDTGPPARCCVGGLYGGAGGPAYADVPYPEPGRPGVPGGAEIGPAGYGAFGGADTGDWIWCGGGFVPSPAGDTGVTAGRTSVGSVSAAPIDDSRAEGGSSAGAAAGLASGAAGPPASLAEPASGVSCPG